MQVWASLVYSHLNYDSLFRIDCRFEHIWYNLRYFKTFTIKHKMLKKTALKYENDIQKLTKYYINLKNINNIVFFLEVNFKPLKYESHTLVQNWVSPIPTKAMEHESLYIRLMIFPLPKFFFYG